MTASLNFGVRAICGFALASSAFAQVDGARYASELRMKYGPALARETFQAKAGLTMVVNYAANANVCRIELPAVAPLHDSNVLSPLAVDEFVTELVPVTIRGKELGRFIMMMGLPAVSFIQYENVTISESLQGSTRTGVTIAFTGETCQDTGSGSLARSNQ